MQSATRLSERYTIQWISERKASAGTSCKTEYSKSHIKKERSLYRPVNNGNKTNIGFILYKNKQPVVRANKNLISHIY